MPLCSYQSKSPSGKSLLAASGIVGTLLAKPKLFKIVIWEGKKDGTSCGREKENAKQSNNDKILKLNDMISKYTIKYLLCLFISCTPVLYTISPEQLESSIKKSTSPDRLDENRFKDFGVAEITGVDSLDSNSIILQNILYSLPGRFQQYNFKYFFVTSNYTPGKLNYFDNHIYFINKDNINRIKNELSGAECFMLVNIDIENDTVVNNSICYKSIVEVYRECPFSGCDRNKSWEKNKYEYVINCNRKPLRFRIIKEHNRFCAR